MHDVRAPRKAVMEDNRVSYDPQGGGSAKPSRAPRILARLPRIEITRPEKITRTDNAEEALHGRHQATNEGLPSSAIVVDPMATVRFDTFPTESGYVEPAAASEESQPITAAVESVERTEEESSWLVQLEAAVLPYERWVALAAVIAALGLTMTLLRAKPAPRIVETPPQADYAESEAPASPTAAPPIIETMVVGAEAPADITATGPAGLPRSEEPRAHLAQSVQPVEPSEAIDRPLQDTLSEDPPAVHSYPRTATAVDSWAKPQGGTLR